MSEQWRVVPGVEGIYEVSDMGRVRSLSRTLVDKNGRSWTLHGRVLRPGSTRGYQTVSLWRGGQQVSVTQVHRLVATAFIGLCPAGQEVRHLNGDPGDNRLPNLRYGTSSENQFDKVRHGRHHNANKTHCAQGHEYTPENTILDRRQWRSCRTCVSMWARRRYQRKLRPDAPPPEQPAAKVTADDIAAQAGGAE